MLIGSQKRSVIPSVLFLLIGLSPLVAKADADFVIPTVGQVDGRVAISTDVFAPELEVIFIDKTDGDVISYFSSYFFQNDVNCAPVTALAEVDGALLRWVPKVSVAEIIGEPRLKIENTDDMIEALFDAELLKVLLVNECNGKEIYTFDLKGYERAMKKIGIE
jgi:hypothetical protein